jgi:hypothetical protein
MCNEEQCFHKSRPQKGFQSLSAYQAVAKTHLVLAMTTRGLLKGMNTSHMLAAWLHRKASTRDISGSFL